MGSRPTDDHTLVSVADQTDQLYPQHLLGDTEGTQFDELASDFNRHPTPLIIRILVR